MQNKSKVFIGIDPGLKGAVGIIDEHGILIEVVDTPVLSVGKKNDYQVIEMVKIFEPYKDKISKAVLEKVHSMPKQGVVSSFNFGKGFGIWQGILSALKIPYDLVTPQRWKGQMMDGMGKEKDASRLRAQQLFPEAELNKKKHVDRAEALLMAEFLRRKG